MCYTWINRYLEARGAVCAYCCALHVGRENGLTLNGDDTRPLIPGDKITIVIHSPAVT